MNDILMNVLCHVDKLIYNFSQTVMFQVNLIMLGWAFHIQCSPEV